MFLCIRYFDSFLNHKQNPVSTLISSFFSFIQLHFFVSSHSPTFDCYKNTVLYVKKYQIDIFCRKKSKHVATYVVIYASCWWYLYGLLLYGIWQESDFATVSLRRTNLYTYKYCASQNLDPNILITTRTSIFEFFSINRKMKLFLTWW